MPTDAHAFYTWLLAKHGARVGRAAGVAGAVGAVAPDVPTGLALLHSGASHLLLGGDVPPGGEAFRAVYLDGFLGSVGSVLHSAVPAVALLALYGVLRLGRVDRRRIVLWFLFGWFGHAVADFLTHVDGTRPLFWPISGWEWSSPVSYYDGRYYGREFIAIEHGGMLVISLWLLRRRLRGQRKRGPG